MYLKLKIPNPIGTIEKLFSYQGIRKEIHVVGRIMPSIYSLSGKI